MKTHAHYHEISADTPHEMGLALGRAFGGALRPFIKALPELPEGVNEFLGGCLTLTREMFPDCVEEVEGYARGAEVPLEKLWHMLLEDDASALAEEKCTTFITNNGRLAGHNEDWSANAASRLFVLKRNLAGKILFELHYAGTPGGNAISINNQGHIQAVNSLPGTPVDASIARVPTNIVARLLAETGDVTGMLEAARSIPRMGGYAHTLVSTKGAPHRIAEFSQKDLAVQEITRFPFVHANHYALQGGQMPDGAASSIASTTRKRYAAAEAGVKPQMTPEDAMQLLENKCPGVPPVLLNANTLAGMVLDIDSSCAWVRLASEPELGWLRYGLDFII